ISYCLHLLIHLFYVGDVEQLLREESTPVFLGALTTIGAFLSLLFTDSDLLRDFGMFASLALAGSTLFALIFLPHFLKDKKGNSETATFKTIERFNSIPFDRKHTLLWILTILIAIGLAFSQKVKFDSDLRNLDYNGADELASETLFNEKNNDGYFHQYFATVSADLDEALEANVSLAAILDSLKSAGDVHDFSDMVSRVFIPEKTQQERIDAWNAFWAPSKKQDVMDRLYAEAGRIGLYPDLFDGFGTILDTEYEPASLLESGVIPDNLLCNFIEKNADGQYMVFTDVSMPAEDKDIVTAALVANPKTFILDPFYYCKDMVQVIHDDFNIAVWISALLVLLILIFSYRNIITALLSFLPMVISWFVVQGYMAIIGLEFNLINIVISTFIFGVGVDYSIFITEGLLARARTGSDEMLGYHKSAIFFSAIILLIVTCSLLFAQHPSIRSIGLSTLIGMACTILFSYAIQPFLFRQLMKIPAYKRSVLKKKPYVADNK
ncbi:MAG: MMPL family transporter, partial [Bacteroidales bacterium]|nr:MMPL family transporter [Bacteroidales bacterium]